LPELSNPTTSNFLSFVTPFIVLTNELQNPIFKKLNKYGLGTKVNAYFRRCRLFLRV
jgi:hypothetical protein